MTKLPITTDITHAVPTDPWAVSGGDEQWHHLGAFGVNTIPVWEDYTGRGVRVVVFDDGINYNHSELSPNYRTDLDLDVLDNDDDALNSAGSYHGTYVAEVLGSDDNGNYGVGVAFDSEIIGIRRGYGFAGTIDDLVDAAQYTFTVGADVMNNSWGTSSAFGDNTKINFIGTDTSEVVAEYLNLASNGRDGLGANIVFSAGNGRAEGMSTNYKNYQNSPYTISVGAFDESGEYTYYTEAGANVLVSAPGDELRVSEPTDNGSAVLVSGTSFAAPVISGIIALMLEANPDLGYRDVQEILALSSRQIDATYTGWADEGWQYNGAMNWNGGGMHFSHDYGYGNVDAHSAVRLAETWGTQQTFSNMTVVPPISSTSSTSIPAIGSVTQLMNVTDDIVIEHVLIDLDIDHSHAGDLVITLTSPEGTESTLVYRVNNGTYTTTFGVYTGINFEFSSVAHWGESSAGQWSLKVEDDAVGDSGTLNSWSLSFLGKEQSDNNVYFYTNEFAGATGGRTVLTDVTGTDTINAAAVTTDTVIDLSLLTGTIAGTALTIGAGTVVENVTTGDGNDTIIGNDESNIFITGKGNDMTSGGNGDDTYFYSGGNDEITDTGGFDTIQLTSDDYLDHFSFEEDPADSNNIFIKMGFYTVHGDIKINNQNSGNAALMIERIIFADGFSADLTNYANWVTGTVFGERIDGSHFADDFIMTGGGDDTSYGLDGDDIIYGAKGVDVLVGGAGNDILWGGAGIDDLHGREDNDTLNGGAGDDNLRGGTGNDTYMASEGLDYIYDIGGIDTILFDEGISLFDLTIMQDAGDLNDYHIKINPGVDEIHIENQSHPSLDFAVDTLAFADGTTANFSTIKHWKFGTAGAENIHGSYFRDDTIIGYDGDDRLYGKDGHDELFGGLGNDYLRGDSGNDHLHGNEGNDFIRGYDGDDFLYAGAGYDKLSGMAGADSFIFMGDDVFDGVLNRITDFSQTDGDLIQIVDALIGFDPLTSIIEDFVTLTQSATHTYLNVDRDGTGTDFSTYQAVRIENISGQWTDINHMITNGDIDIS